ncbi:MAG: hypothetical protein IPO15_04775 [Anaerolineae bacterium]|uniref:hypothetical protein n=1 Tax=Candidatus Amarolinea dominans TaxID=3140696 RepID=UPI003136C649|nr:hypothetical protein [Anaerolineae bacterium]
MNDYVAKGSANAVSSALILSKLIVASSESHDLKQGVGGLHGHGLHQLGRHLAVRADDSAGVRAHRQPGHGTGGSGTPHLRFRLDLRGYNALGVAVRWSPATMPPPRCD